MNWTLGYIFVGALLVIVALSGSLLKRLPLTTAVLYLAIGLAIGPNWLGWIHLDPIHHAHLLERLTEVVVLVSLFTAGLKLRVPLQDKIWRLPIRLASISMIVTIALLTLVGYYALGLSVGAAVLLAAVLAPTDPVLASDVQVGSPTDRDRLRFSLTAEAGMNDGTAFPFVMLGLMLLNLNDPDHGWLYWVSVDLIWAVAAGLGVGALCGTLIGRLVIFLRQTKREAVGLDEFLSLGLLALSYGLALSINSYGFLAVFAAGLALRRIEALASDGQPPPHVGVTGNPPGAEEIATDEKTAPAFMAHAVLGFNEQLERLSELAIVLLIGVMLTPTYLTWTALWFVPLLFLVIRPIAVGTSLFGSRTNRAEASLVAWFGIRGVGSLYYLSFAIAHGLGDGDAHKLAPLLLTTVAISIVLHGISSTPLMNFYGKKADAEAGPTPDKPVDDASGNLATGKA